MKKNNQSLVGTLLSAGLALALLAPVSAQVTETTKGSDAQKPVISTYDKAPNASGNSQSLDSTTYNQDKKANSADVTPRNADNATPRNSDMTTPRNVDTATTTTTTESGTESGIKSEAQSQTRSETQRGDTQKPVVPTYNGVPEAQSREANENRNDVSNVRTDNGGDTQKPVVPTYNKMPDPKGDNQNFDAVRLEQSNDATNGRESTLKMKVVEGSVEGATEDADYPGN